MIYLRIVYAVRDWIKGGGWYVRHVEAFQLLAGLALIKPEMSCRPTVN